MDEPTRPLARRTVLRGVALAGGGLGSAGLLAACGSDDEPAAESGSGSGSTSEPLGAVSDVKVGSATIFTDQKVVVSQPTEGEFKAFSTICTHMQCPVDAVEGDEIVCPCHGSRFSIADGSPTAGPATEPLGAETVTVDGDNLVLG